MKKTLSTIAIAVCCTLLSCSKQESKQTDVVTFPLKGEVVAIDTAKMRITIDHEEIPDYMMAMTMPFKVKNPELLRSVTIGDTVQGVLAVSRTESWLETFTVTGKGDAPDPQLIEGSILAKVFKEGDVLPPLSFTNQDGKRIRFSDYKGKAVAITFIYTRCPLPDFCILMSNHFAKLQKLLKKEEDIAGKWHLLTISFDPKFDTPSVLKDYGKSYNADFTTWEFATDSISTIYKLADGLGLTFSDDEGLIAHNLRTVILDKEGTIVKVINGNEWSPEEIKSEIKKIANG